MYFKIQGTYFKIYALYFSRKITPDFQLLTKALNSAFFLCEIRHLRSRNAPHFHVFTVREFRACRISYNRYMVLYNRHRKVSHTKIPAIILHKTKRNEDREKQQNPASRPDYNHCSRYRIVWHSHKTHKIL